MIYKCFFSWLLFIIDFLEKRQLICLSIWQIKKITHDQFVLKTWKIKRHRIHFLILDHFFKVVSFMYSLLFKYRHVIDEIINWHEYPPLGPSSSRVIFSFSLFWIRLPFVFWSFLFTPRFCIQFAPQVQSKTQKIDWRIGGIWTADPLVAELSLSLQYSNIPSARLANLDSDLKWIYLFFTLKQVTL